MGTQQNRRLADLLIRSLGLLGISLSAGACLWLYRLLHAAPPPAPSLGQYALATITFLGASIGSGLLILGRHIHDRIEIAERYRRRWSPRISRRRPSGDTRHPIH